MSECASRLLKDRRWQLRSLVEPISRQTKGSGANRGNKSGFKKGYQDFLLPGIFVPGSESSQWETFTPRNESSRELSLLRTNIPGNFRSRELSFLVVSSLSDHGKGCLQYADARHCSESKLKKIVK